MTSKIDRLAGIFSDHISIAWPQSSSGAQRVIMLVYEPADERALRRKIDLFAQGAEAVGKSWHAVDLTSLSAEWLAGHKYRDTYFEEPEEFAESTSDRMAGAIAATLEARLSGEDHGRDSVLAVHGTASLYGFTSLSDVLSKVEHAIVGRLLVFFPGRVQDGRYRLLDARESWDYHAVPITLDDLGDVR